MSGERSEHIAAVPCTRCGHAIRVHVEVMTPRLSAREIAAEVVALLRAQTPPVVVPGPRK